MILFKRPKFLWPPSLWRDKCSNWIMLKPSTRQHIPSSIHIRPKHFTFLLLSQFFKYVLNLNARMYRCLWIIYYCSEPITVPTASNIYIHIWYITNIIVLHFIIRYYFDWLHLLRHTTTSATFCIRSPFRIESATSFALYIASISKKRYIGNWK